MLRSHMVSLMSVWLCTASRFSLWRGRHIRLFICQSLVRTKAHQYNPNTVANLTHGSVCTQCLFLAFLLPGCYFLSFLSHLRRLLTFSLAWCLCAERDRCSSIFNGTGDCWCWTATHDTIGPLEMFGVFYWHCRDLENVLAALSSDDSMASSLLHCTGAN